VVLSALTSAGGQPWDEKKKRFVRKGGLALILHFGKVPLCKNTNWLSHRLGIDVEVWELVATVRRVCRLQSASMFLQACLDSPIGTND
jgi:hypothetical protein